MIKQINSLNTLRKQNLIRSYDKKEINKNEYLIQLKEIEKLIKDEQLLVLNKEKQELSDKQVSEEPKMVDATESNVKVDEKKVSRADLVAKALQMKSIKNIDKAVEIIVSWQPEFKPGVVKSVVKQIIKEAIAGKGRWKAYTWDEANFKLVPKTA